MKKSFKRKQNGITLIALVITIIILLILVGITIGVLAGKNGLIQKAKDAEEQTETADEKELVETSVIQAMGKSKYGDIEMEEMKI